MNLHLDDKVVLLTGGAKGIGQATMRAFAAEGARVLFLDRDAKAGKKLAADCARSGHAVFFSHANLAKPSDCEKAVKAALRRFGRIDVLVNNAGFNDGIALGRPLKEFAGSLERNLFHVYELTRLCAPHIAKTKGAVINVSSKVSVTGQGATSGYAAAKGAINALTREWALALAPQGVRVNTVVPAECDTDSYRAWFATLKHPMKTRAAIERMIPLGQRMTRPEEIADMIVFLASVRASHVTGQLVFVDGGYTHLDRAFGHDHSKWS